MWKNCFFFLLILLSISCRNEKEKERERAKYVEDSIARVNEERKFRQNRERIEPTPEPKKEPVKPTGSLYSRLPKKWILLGIYRGQKVIYIPCGADEAPHFILHDVNTNNPKIFFNYADEQKTYFIANLKQTKGIFRFNLVRYYEEEGGMTSSLDKLDLDVNNKGKELIVDLLVNEPGVAKTRFEMIPESEMENYMIVKQDPLECKGSPIE